MKISQTIKLTIKKILCHQKRHIFEQLLLISVHAIRRQQDEEFFSIMPEQHLGIRNKNCMQLENSIFFQTQQARKGFPAVAEPPMSRCHHRLH